MIFEWKKVFTRPNSQFLAVTNCTCSRRCNIFVEKNTSLCGMRVTGGKQLTAAFCASLCALIVDLEALNKGAAKQQGSDVRPPMIHINLTYSKIPFCDVNGYDSLAQSCRSPEQWKPTPFTRTHMNVCVRCVREKEWLYFGCWSNKLPVISLNTRCHEAWAISLKVFWQRFCDWLIVEAPWYNREWFNLERSSRWL